MTGSLPEAPPPDDHLAGAGHGSDQADPPGDDDDLDDEIAPEHRVPEGDDGMMSLVDHLEELRARLIRSLAALGLGFGIAWSRSDLVLDLVTRTSPLRKFVFLDPAEAFFTHLRVSFWAGLLLATPILLYQAWQFLRPAMTVAERTATRALFPFILFFFGAGVLFAYSTILPVGLAFLLGFATPELTPMLSISSFSTFVLVFLLVFGVAFELPVVLFFASRVGLVDAAMLSEFRPWFVVGIMTVAAILTPPDVVSQLLLGIPMWFLYEATVVVIRFFPGGTPARRRQTRDP